MAVYYDEIKTKGRPQKVLNKEGIETIQKLAEIMCTDEEIAGIIGMTTDTLMNARNRELFTAAREKGRTHGKESLRRLQFKIAQNGNASMAIWLGKQYLGQTDKQETTINDASVSFEIVGASKIKIDDEK